MKNSILLLTLICLVSFSQAQVTVQLGTGFWILPGTTLSTSGFTATEDSKIFIEGDLRLTGNAMTVNEEIDFTGRLIVEGGKQIDGTNPFAVRTLYINTPGGVTINNRLTIYDSVIMKKGIVHVDTASPLQFAVSAVNPVEHSGSYIDGRSIMQVRLVDQNSIPLFLGCSISGGDDLDSVSITRTTGNKGIIYSNKSESVAANWEVRTTGNPLVSNRNISLHWLPEQDNKKNISELAVYGSVLGHNDFERLTNNNHPLINNNNRAITFRVDQLHQVFTLSDISHPLSTYIFDPAIAQIYPNPFMDKMIVRMERTRDNPVEVRIITILGQIMYQSKLIPKNNRIVLKGLGHLMHGTYWLHIYSRYTHLIAPVIKLP